MTSITVPVAFIAGLVSFLSPCVLPIIPGFLAYLAGTTTDTGTNKRRTIFLCSLFFVLGFSIIFSLLGVLLNTILARVAYGAQTWLARIGGTIVIIFGLYLSGLLKIPALERNRQLRVPTGLRSPYLTAFLFGAAFAAGWTPCVGAVLGSVLALAATQGGAAFPLLLAYTLGLGLPFLVVGSFTAQAEQWIARHNRHFHLVTVAFGFVLIVLGVLVFTQSLSRVANFELLNRFLLR